MGAFIKHVIATGRLSESLVQFPAFIRCNSSVASLEKEATTANEIKDESGYGCIFYSGWILSYYCYI